MHRDKWKAENKNISKYSKLVSLVKYSESGSCFKTSRSQWNESVLAACWKNKLMITTAAGAERVSPSSTPSAHPSPHPQRSWCHGVQRPSSPSSDTTGRTSGLLTSTHFFILCVCNLAPAQYYGSNKNALSSTDTSCDKVPLSKILSTIIMRLKAFLEKIIRWRLCVFFWFICRSGLIQRCSYSIFTVEISFLLPHKHPPLTLKTNLLSLALSYFRMRLLRVCLAFRFSHSSPCLCWEIFVWPLLFKPWSVRRGGGIDLILIGPWKEHDLTTFRPEYI